MKTYEKAKLDILEIDKKDVIATSGTIGKDDGSNDGEWID